MRQAKRGGKPRPTPTDPRLRDGFATRVAGLLRRALQERTVGG
jgi:hypothetical protein